MDGPSWFPRRIRRRAREAADSRALHVLGRAGIAASGVLNLVAAAVVIGVLAGTDRGSQGGALQQLAQIPGGVVLLAVLAICLLGLAVWMALLAIAVGRRTAPRTRARWRLRARRGGLALVYAALGIAAVNAAFDPRATGTRSATSWLLERWWGIALLFAVGAGIAIAGLVFAAIGVRRTFLNRDLDPPPGRPRRVVAIVGVTGYVGRGIAFLVVGVLIAVGALTTDPTATSGLGGALVHLAGSPFGIALLVVVAAGCVAYAGFMMLKARYTDLA